MTYSDPGLETNAPRLSCGRKALGTGRLIDARYRIHDDLERRFRCAGIIDDHDILIFRYQAIQLGSHPHQMVEQRQSAIGIVAQSGIGFEDRPVEMIDDPRSGLEIADRPLAVDDPVATDVRVAIDQEEDRGLRRIGAERAHIIHREAFEEAAHHQRGNVAIEEDQPVAVERRPVFRHLLDDRHPAQQAEGQRVRVAPLGAFERMSGDVRTSELERDRAPAARAERRDDTLQQRGLAGAVDSLEREQVARLEQIGLDHQIDRRPRRIDGGQRVGFGRVIVDPHMFEALLGAGRGGVRALLLPSHHLREWSRRRSGAPLVLT